MIRDAPKENQSDVRAHQNIEYGGVVLGSDCGLCLVWGLCVVLSIDYGNNDSLYHLALDVYI